MKRGGHNAEFCELCTPLLTAGDPRKGCHGEQTALFGRETQGNFSLSPVNLGLGERQSINGGWGQLLPEATSCFQETLPFPLEMINGD